MGREQLIWPHQLGPSHRPLPLGTSELRGLAARRGLEAPKASGTAVCSLGAVLSPRGCDQTPSSAEATCCPVNTAISQGKGAPQSPHPRPGLCLALSSALRKHSGGWVAVPFTDDIISLGWGPRKLGSLRPAPPGPAEWMGPLCTRPATLGALQLRSICKPEFHLLKLGF